MDSTFRKVALAAATLGLVLSLFLALRPDDGDDDAVAPATTAAETVAPPTVEELPATTETETEPPPATTEAPAGPQIVDIDAESGEIVRVTIEQGRRVVLNISADVADHAHLHGYDLLADVAPGRVAKISFTADVPGRFEVELEERGIPIADLQIRP
jgi:hypothetical protein